MKKCRFPGNETLLRLAGKYYVQYVATEEVEQLVREQKERWNYTQTFVSVPEKLKYWWNLFDIHSPPSSRFFAVVVRFLWPIDNMKNYLEIWTYYQFGIWTRMMVLIPESQPRCRTRLSLATGLRIQDRTEQEVPFFPFFYQKYHFSSRTDQCWFEILMKCWVLSCRMSSRNWKCPRFIQISTNRDARGLVDGRATQLDALTQHWHTEVHSRGMSSICFFFLSSQIMLIIFR